MANDSTLEPLFAALNGTGWGAAVTHGGQGVCVDLVHPEQHPEPVQFCGSLADVVEQAQRYVAQYQASPEVSDSEQARQNLERMLETGEENPV